MKKLQHSGSMSRQTRSSRRGCVRSDGLLDFTTYSTNTQNEI